MNYHGLRDVDGSGNQISWGSALTSRMTSKSIQKLHYCGFQLLFRYVLYYSVLLLTKLYFKHVQWIIKRQSTCHNCLYMSTAGSGGGGGGTQSSLCCIDCKIDYRDVKFEMRVPAVDLTVKWFLRCSPNMLQWTALITVMVITSFKYILAYK